MARLAINGGSPVRTRPWPKWPVFGEEERQHLLDVLETHEWGGFPEPQPRARKFADAFARWTDAQHGICVSNGSITLEIALRAAGIHAGDEVIVPCLTWVATAACAIHVNAVPVMVDVDPKNYCIDPAAVEAAITPKTRAIIPVHLGSSIADLDRLTEIAKKHNLVLIEDCAHAHGSKWRGKGVGSWGDFGSFSFQSSKIMTAGEGGFITTNDRLLAQKVHSLVNCGRKTEEYNEFPGTLFGYNARMTEFQAGVLLGQLSRMDSLIEKKAAAVRYLGDALNKLGGFSIIEQDPRETRRGIYQVIFKYNPEEFKGLHRDRFLDALEAEGVELSGPFYVPIPMSPLFNARTEDYPMLRERYGDGIQSPETLRKFRFPVASKVAFEEGCWMHYPYLLGTQQDLDDIINAIAKVKENCEELL